MRFFLHEGDQIRIINEPDEFTCSYSQFQILEPLYPALSAGKNIRYWTPENAYLDGDHREPIDHDCGPYTLKVSEYVAPGPFIYAHVTLSKTSICINSLIPDHIDFECHLKASTDPEGADLPINRAWYIMLRNSDGNVADIFQVNFVNGSFAAVYTYQFTLQLGDYHLEESDFIPVMVGNTTYTVKLMHHNIFTVYREL
jgi:hypothetical protein